jgi:hypothetical protein
MYDPRLIPPGLLGWVMVNAQNELNAYLCEIDYHKVNKNWPQAARQQANNCRAIAAAAMREQDRDSWLELADLYEDSAAPRG